MKKIMIAVGLSLFAMTALAQVKVSTGGEKGTYHKFFQSIQMVCGDKVSGGLLEVGSGGSDDNIDNLVNKVADAGFVQSDTLQFVSMNDPRASDANIRVLVALYPEEVHVVALRDLSKATGGFMGIGKTKTSIDSLSDLSGTKVGAWGGSYTTARAIAYLGGVQYDTIQFKNDKEALAALNKGEIAAIIAVGGQPLGFVTGLTADYKLLKIDGGLAGKVKAYSPAKVTYKNVGAVGVETVAARSMLVVKNYTTEDRRNRFAALKACLNANEMEFKEGTGHHPKWSDVDLKAPAVWATYDVGTSAVAPVAPISVKAKK